MLAYAEDFDVVYGSRTVKELIWEGANMGLFLKWGNYSVAKLMEFLFNTTSLTDVGCTLRCVRRDALRRIEPFFSVAGSFFGPQMMVLSILMKQKMIQIPVNYSKRVGTSSVTGNTWTAFRLGVRMILLIVHYRLSSWLFRSRFRQPPAPTSREVSLERGSLGLPTADLTLEPDDEEEKKTGQS